VEKLDGKSMDIVQENIAKLKDQYGADDLMRVVFRDNGFKDAEIKTNAIQMAQDFIFLLSLFIVLVLVGHL